MVQSSCTELGAVISVPTGMHKTLCDKRHSGTRPPTSHFTEECEAQRKAANTLVAQTEHFHNHFRLRIYSTLPKPKDGKRRHCKVSTEQEIGRWESGLSWKDLDPPRFGQRDPAPGKADARVPRPFPVPSRGSGVASASP